MTRQKALAALKAAGAEGDQKAFLRIYTEHRISLQVAREAYKAGEQLARFVRQRDSEQML